MAGYLDVEPGVPLGPEDQVAPEALPRFGHALRYVFLSYKDHGRADHNPARQTNLRRARPVRPMSDFFEAFGQLSYAGIFAALVAVNAAPVLMPPSWIILASFGALDPSLDPLYLALVGATAATLGRMVLKQAGSRMGGLVGEQQRGNMGAVARYLQGKKYGYTLASFLFAATPLPSNMLFIAYGLMRARSAGLYLGFWAGRAASYYVMISVSEVVLAPFAALFADRYVGILVADAAGIAVIFLFMSVDWAALVTQRRLRFTRPRLWRR